MPQTKLLIVTPSLHIGGAEKHVVDLSRNLKSKGFLVEVVSSGGILEDELIKSDIRHIKLGVNTKNFLSFKTIFLLRQFIRQGKYAILHIHSVIPTILCWLASLGLGCKIVVSVHGLESSKYTYAGKVLNQLSNRVIAVSHGIYDDLLAGGMKREKLEIVHNGIETSKFSPCFCNNELNRINIGAVGRLSPEKGHKYLIEAMSKLREREIKCFIVGGGRLEDELRELAERMNVADKIIFTGFVSDVQSIMKQMDIIVMPSLREGLPIALLEAMAMGKAVIASKVGGIPDVISHNKTGLLVQPANVEYLSSAIEYLLDHPEVRLALGKDAHQCILDKFQIEKMVDEIISVYHKTLNKKNLSSIN